MDAPTLDGLAAILNADPVQDQVPAGFHTLKEFAAHVGISRAQAQAKLHQGVKDGLVEVRRFKVKTGQVTRPVPHYRPIDMSK